MYKQSTKEILYLLLKCDTPLRIKDIAQQLHMSEKTVWNKLHDERMDGLLNAGVKLEIKTNQGVALRGDAKALRELKTGLDNFIEHENEDEIYRNHQIIAMLLMRDERMTIQDLMDHFLMSKKHLSLCLADITIRLRRFSLYLEKRQNAGIRICGDEIDIRQLFENTILQLCGFMKHDHHQNTMFDESITAILKELQMDEYLENALVCVKQIQQELLGAFTDEGKKEIVIQILISNRRCMHGNAIDALKPETLTSNAQFQQFLKIFETNRIFLKENDYLYLWKRCVTNRFSASADKRVDDKFLMLSRELLYSILDLEKEENGEMEYLIRNLAFHINQAVSRSNAGIRVHNPILQKVKQKYGKFYSLVLTNVSKFESEYQIALNEDEIGFITIYICAIYEKSIANQYYRVLLVSDEGVGQTQLLSMHIVNNFPNLLIHQTSSSLHVFEQQAKESDIIIATCPLLLRKEERHKYIRISSFIDQQDLQNISAHLLSMGKLNKKEENLSEPETSIDFKYFDAQANSREEILQTYLQMAEQFGYCDEHYFKTVLQRETRASTSIGKGIAIPHGDDTHILKPAVFFVRNAQPLCWGEDHVDIIIFLILKFNDISENKQFFMRLYSCVSKTELVRQIKDRESLKTLEDYIQRGGSL